MVTFTSLSDFDGYVVPASGETIVLQIDDNYNSYSYSFEFDFNVVSFSGEEDGWEEAQTFIDDGACSFYNLVPGARVTVTIEIGPNTANTSCTGIAYDTDFFGVVNESYDFTQEAASAPSRYYAEITGGANISVPVNPLAVYTGNSNHMTLEFNGDNLRTDGTRSNGAVWIRTSGGWFSFEMYGQGWEYLNLGSTTYIGQYDYWSTSGFDSTFVTDINNGSVTLTKGQQTSATTFGGTLGTDMVFFHSNYGQNVRMYFYRLAIYGGDNRTLLYDFVPDYSGTTKGLRDKVSGDFYAATDQTKMTLYGLKTFETDIDSISASYSGTSTSVTVTADSNLTWTASTNDSWISITNPTGSGNGSFTVVVSANREHSTKTGTVTVTSSEGDELTISVSQEKAPSLVSQKPLYRNGDSVVKMYRSGELIYFKVNPHTTPPEPPTPVYKDMPLTFEIISGGSIVWKAGNSATQMAIQYSLNDGAWTTITSSTAGVSINVSAGDTVQFKGTNATYSTQSGAAYANTFSATTAVFNAYGNIMSLISGDNFQTAMTFSATYVFRNFFYTTKLIDASNLVLPATGLTEGCYMAIFGSTHMVTPPKLPATVLAKSCYFNMFLSASSLTVAPELPATVLTENCYRSMLYGCSSLSAITCLATNISASNCVNGWVNGVASSGTFTKAASMTSWSSGTSGIPSGWTVLDYTG